MVSENEEMRVMGESKHTPPGGLYVEDRCERAVILRPGADHEIASVEGTDDPDHGEEQAAYADLFAAAPLMLEALREGHDNTFADTLETVAGLIVVTGREWEHGETAAFLRRKASEVRAAIKAATGGAE